MTDTTTTITVSPKFTTAVPTSRRRPIGRCVGLVMAAAGLLASVAACGSDADAGDDAQLTQQYCDSIADVERQAEQIFTSAIDTAGGDELTIEQEFAAERDVLAYIQQQGYDRQDIPEAIAADWRVYLDGVATKLAAATPTEPSVETQAAEERLLVWEEANCGS